VSLCCAEAKGEHDQARKPHGTQNALQKASPRVQRRTIIDGKESDSDEQDEDGDPCDQGVSRQVAPPRIGNHPS
jgi:hypothetical protein